MKHRVSIVLLALTWLAPYAFAAEPPVRILASHAVEGAIAEIRPLLAARVGTEVTVEYGMTAALLDRVMKGESPDIVVLSKPAVQQLSAKGAVRSQVDLGSSLVGVAVADDAPRPVLKTAEDFAAFLRQTPSIAYTASGASGVHMAKIIEQLGLTEVVKSKATVTAGGLAVTLLLEGKVAAAVQQITELKSAGLKNAVPLPDALQVRTVFTAALLEGAPRNTASSKTLNALISPEFAPIYERSGLSVQ